MKQIELRIGDTCPSCGEASLQEDKPDREGNVQLYCPDPFCGETFYVGMNWVDDKDD
jgi:predicted RNA-binding Zn-ribbon protein involved in translation (DUF1610 family)